MLKLLSCGRKELNNSSRWDQQIPADACQVHKCFFFFKNVFDIIMRRNAMWAAVCVSEMKTQHVACDDLEEQHGKIMLILGGRRQTYIKILRYQHFRMQKKCHERSEKDEESLGYFAWQKSGCRHPLRWTPQTVDNSLVSFFFGGGYRHTHCERFYFAACLHPRIQFLDSQTFGLPR